MKVLIACEHSGTVREQFRARGHDAWSCDLLHSSDKSEFHYHTDIFQVLRWDKWDILIAHPPCTYLTNSAAWAYPDPDFSRYPGVGYHMKVKADTLTGVDRRLARKRAIQFALELWNAPVPRICIENPVGELSNHLGESQLVQPYQFGDDASKGTCLWLKGLPPLIPEGCGEFWCNLHRKHASECPCKPVDEWGEDPYSPCIKRWGNQTDSGQNRLSPSEDRAHVRAITYPGIAQAMAEQWG